MEFYVQGDTELEKTRVIPCSSDATMSGLQASWRTRVSVGDLCASHRQPEQARDTQGVFGDRKAATLHF